MFSAAEIDRFNALNPTLYQYFKEAMDEVPMVRDQIFNVRPSTQNSEHFEGVGDMPTDAFRQFKATGVIGQSKTGAGFATDFRVEEYPLDLSYSWADIRDMNSMKMQIDTQTVAEAYRQFLEEEAASVFNNGFDADFPGGDGKPLFDNAHPQSPNDTGSTWDNRGTTALSVDSIKSTRLAMRTAQSAAGKPLGLRPNAILVHPNNYDNADIFLRSERASGGNDNDVNTLRGEFQLIEWEYLTDTDNWFMLDLRAAQRSLFWFNREEMLMRPKPQESNQVTVKYGMNAAFSKGWVWPRFAYGHVV